MKPGQFFNQVEHDCIHRAIQSAEKKTAGRIVLYVSRRKIDDALKEGHHLFRKLHLEKTGLLLLVAPRTQKFSVVGGTALHEKLGQEWWDHLAETIGGHFRENRYTEGLLAAIDEAGRKFHDHFPAAGPAEDAPDIIEE